MTALWPLLLAVQLALLAHGVVRECLRAALNLCDLLVGMGLLGLTIVAGTLDGL